MGTWVKGLRIRLDDVSCFDLDTSLPPRSLSRMLTRRPYNLPQVVSHRSNKTPTAESADDSFGDAPPSAPVNTPPPQPLSHSPSYSSASSETPLSTPLSDFQSDAAEGDQRRTIRRKHRSTEALGRLVRKASLAFKGEVNQDDPGEEDPNATVTLRTKALEQAAASVRHARHTSSDTRPTASILHHASRSIDGATCSQRRFAYSHSVSLSDAHPERVERGMNTHDLRECFLSALGSCPLITLLISVPRLSRTARSIPTSTPPTLPLFEFDFTLWLPTDRRSRILAEWELTDVPRLTPSTSTSTCATLGSEQSSDVHSPAVSEADHSSVPLPYSASLDSVEAGVPSKSTRDLQLALLPPLRPQLFDRTSKQLLPVLLHQTGRIRLPDDEDNDGGDGLSVDLESWPLPPPRRTWYEMDGKTGRRKLKSALVDL